MLKTEGVALGFQHSPRDLANVNEWKIMFDPYIVGSERNGQNSLRIEDMGNYTCQVMSSASTDTVSKSTFLSIECK